MNKNFCCKRMMFAIEDIACPLGYSPEARYYGMSAPKSLLKKNEVWPGYRIDFCPYCGTKLPKELIDERSEVLEKEYGITDPYDTQKKRIPAQFMTDEWWKKRGL